MRLTVVDLLLKKLHDRPGRLSDRTRGGGGPGDDPEEIDLASLAQSGGADPVVTLVNVMLVDASKRGASDVHVEPYEKEFRVRFRIDGVLYNVLELPLKMRVPLTARLRQMAKLNVHESRLPQDGRFRVRLGVEDGSRVLDVRVSIVPTEWGEKVVLRVRDRSRLVADMGRLGFEPSPLDRFRRALSRTSGLVLVAGPRRSGKATTVGAALASLNRPDARVVPATERLDAGEDPETVLRSLVLADAGVVVGGEIRDPESASLAVGLAEQGQLVLSTLYASDTLCAVLRLLKLGVNPYVAATNLRVVVAQRLIRRVCRHCSVLRTDDALTSRLIELGVAASDLDRYSSASQGQGCANCFGTGYRGLLGLYEVLEISETIAGLITARAGALEIRKAALAEGMITLRASGLEKIRYGVTTVEEVLRETVPGARYVAESSPAFAPGGQAALPALARPTAPAGGGEADRHASELRSARAEIARLQEELRVARHPGTLAVQLANANADIGRLKQRLFEPRDRCAVALQLASADAEVERLRQQVCELHSYQVAYERLAGERPRNGNSGS